MTAEMSFLEHIGELRTRVLRSVIGVGVGFVIVYSQAEWVFSKLMEPLCGAFKNRECQLITLGLAEAFVVYLKTAIVGGIFLAAPWVFFQVWQFISPGLHAHEKKYLWPFVLSASVMFAGGGAFGYFFVFPFAFEFFLNLAGPEIMPTPSMANYFSFAVSLLFAFGALFELPVLVILLNLLGVLAAKDLWKTWRYAIVGIFILSAILTPADPFTMVLLAVPLSLLYLGALVVCSVLEKRKQKSLEATE